MRHELAPFPSASVDSSFWRDHFKVAFEASRSSGRIDFSFTLTDSARPSLPGLKRPEVVDPHARQRRDELWKSTCLEIFAGEKGETSYVELNLSPAGHWNVYAFDSMRARMRPAADSIAPLISCETKVGPNGEAILVWRGALVADHSLPAAEVTKVLGARTVVMSATAVMEYQSGDKSYWAIAHKGEKPDFHLRESFILEFELELGP